jgi:hypothetical protein
MQCLARIPFIIDVAIGFSPQHMPNAGIGRKLP